MDEKAEGGVVVDYPEEGTAVNLIEKLVPETNSSTEEPFEPLFQDYLPSIKAKFKNLTIWYRELRAASVRLSTRVTALEQKVDKKRCPKCGGEVW